MAYNKGYNPDALPAHVEPEQAAAMLSQGSRQNSNPTSSRPQSGSPAQQPSSYNNKPPPPLPPNAQSQAGGGPGRGWGGGGGGPAGYGNDRYGADPYASGAGRGGGRNYNNLPPVPSQEFYGMGSPPAPPQGAFQQPSYHRQSQSSARPPPTPAPIIAGADPALFQLFKSVDTDGSGRLTERELRAALVNSDHSSFDPHTVRLMIRMFDTDNDGSIGFQEFSGLWGFLSAWRELFDRFDEDRSGYISYDEYSKALVAFGYRLTPSFVHVLYRTYNKRGDDALSFDLFVQSCISLKRMTDVFKKYDDDRDGYITLSFEEFLTEILRQR